MDADFLSDSAPGGGFVGFVGLDLAAGEFPKGRGDACLADVNR